MTRPSTYSVSSRLALKHQPAAVSIPVSHVVSVAVRDRVDELLRTEGTARQVGLEGRSCWMSGAQAGTAVYSEAFRALEPFDIQDICRLQRLAASAVRHVM